MTGLSFVVRLVARKNCSFRISIRRLRVGAQKRWEVPIPNNQAEAIQEFCVTRLITGFGTRTSEKIRNGPGCSIGQANSIGYVFGYTSVCQHQSRTSSDKRQFALWSRQ